VDLLVTGADLDVDAWPVSSVVAVGARTLRRVISDSIPWREQLLTVADTLKRRKVQRRWTERTSFLVERDIMVSAYAVRKLNEAHQSLRRSCGT
jgi:hypothetical protein